MIRLLRIKKNSVLVPPPFLRLTDLRNKTLGAKATYSSLVDRQTVSG